MDNETINTILSLATFAFTDLEFNKVKALLENKQYNELRLYVEDLLEVLEIRKMLDSTNEKLSSDITHCGKIDALITNAYIDQVAVWES